MVEVSLDVFRECICELQNYSTCSLEIILMQERVYRREGEILTVDGKKQIIWDPDSLAF